MSCPGFARVGMLDMVPPVGGTTQALHLRSGWASRSSCVDAGGCGRSRSIRRWRVETPGVVSRFRDSEDPARHLSGPTLVDLHRDSRKTPFGAPPRRHLTGPLGHRQLGLELGNPRTGRHRLVVVATREAGPLTGVDKFLFVPGVGRPSGDTKG